MIQISRKNFIFPDTVRQLDVTDINHERLVQILKSEIEKNTDIVGSVVHLVPYKRIKVTTPEGKTSEGKYALTAEDFFSKLGEQIPGRLLRSLIDPFFLGIHIYEENDPFLIVKTDSYQAAFAGMLEWENDILFDIGPIFLTNPEEEGGAADSFEGKKFKDAVIFNKDARVVRNLDGKVIFLYSFVDKETLLITKSEATLREVAERIRTAKSAK